MDAIQEDVALIGGYKTGGPHKSIVLLDRTPDEGISSAGTILDDLIAYTVCAGNDSLIFSGGFDLSTRSSKSRIQIYNVNANSWTDLPDLPGPSYWHGAAFVKGLLHCFGGRYEANGELKELYSTVRSLNIESGAWNDCPGLPFPLDQVGIAVVEDDIVVIGGGTGSPNTWSNQICRYNTTTKTMTVCQPMPKPGDNVFRSTVAVDHRVYILAKTLFLCYDVRADQWTELLVPAKTSLFSAMVLKQDQLIVTGGHDGDWEKLKGQVQIYDTKKNEWSQEEKSMPLKLAGHWAFLVKLRK